MKKAEGESERISLVAPEAPGGISPSRLRRTTDERSAAPGPGPDP